MTATENQLLRLLVRFSALLTLTLSLLVCTGTISQAAPEPADDFAGLCPNVKPVSVATNKSHNRAVIVCYLGGKIENKDPAYLDRLFSHDAVVHRPLGLTLHLKQVKDAISGFKLCSAQTDFRRMLADGDSVSVLLTHHAKFCAGTKLMAPGSAAGPNDAHYPAPETPVSWDAQAMFRFAPDGRIIEEWVNLDQYGYLQAVGVKVSVETCKNPSGCRP